jgi:hypothetical protein
MASFEEEGELPARARARSAVRSVHVHVPTARAWRLQVGQRADPGVRHLRRVQAPAAILTWAGAGNGLARLARIPPCPRRRAEVLRALRPVSEPVVKIDNSDDGSEGAGLLARDPAWPRARGDGGNRTRRSVNGVNRDGEEVLRFR